MFFTQATFKSVLADQVIVGMMALGLLVPFIAGAFDLSIGAMVSFSFVLMAWFSTETDLNIFITALLAIGACGLIGLVSGILTVKFRVNSFIATLGVSQVLTAAILYISVRASDPRCLQREFLNFGQADWAGIPRSSSTS